MWWSSGGADVFNLRTKKFLHEAELMLGHPEPPGKDSSSRTLGT